MTNIGTKTVSCDTIGSNTEKDKICPVMGIGKNAFFLQNRDFSGTVLLICVDIESHKNSSRWLSISWML